MKLDADKLRAWGFTVTLVDGGVDISSPESRHPVFLPMVGDELQLVPSRSALHRHIVTLLESPLPPEAAA